MPRFETKGSWSAPLEGGPLYPEKKGPFYTEKVRNVGYCAEFTESPGHSVSTASTSYRGL